MAHKKLICLDFDGVLHSYESGWQGCDKIADGPVPGAMEFLRRLVKDGRFDVVIHSSRCSDPAGIEAIKKWLAKHIMGSAPTRIDGDFLVPDGKFDGRAIFEAIRVVDKKPPAAVTLDDRALTFDGSWPDLDKLAGFVPWNKKTANQTRRAAEKERSDREAEIEAATMAVSGIFDRDGLHSSAEVARAAIDAYLGQGGYEVFDLERVRDTENWLRECLDAELGDESYSLGWAIIDGEAGWTFGMIGGHVDFLSIKSSREMTGAVPGFAKAMGAIGCGRAA